jgi:hypothetical protein
MMSVVFLMLSVTLVVTVLLRVVMQSACKMLLC